MNRALYIFICRIALGSLHFPGAAAPERPKSMPVNEPVAYAKVLKRCQQVENPILVPGSALYGIDPVGWVRNELGTNWPKRPRVTAKIELVPKHGTIVEDYVISDVSKDFPFYIYIPKTDFHGKDHANIAVSVDGMHFLVDFTIQVVQVTVDGKCHK
jgi:hypothetical protein